MLGNQISFSFFSFFLNLIYNLSHFSLFSFLHTFCLVNNERKCQTSAAMSLHHKYKFLHFLATSDLQNKKSKECFLSSHHLLCTSLMPLAMFFFLKAYVYNFNNNVTIYLVVILFIYSVNFIFTRL